MTVMLNTLNLLQHVSWHIISKQTEKKRKETGHKKVCAFRRQSATLESDCQLNNLFSSVFQQCQYTQKSS